MTDLAALLRLARLGLMVLVASLAGGALAVWGMQAFEQRLRLELTATESQVTAETARLQDINAELTLLTSSYDKFEALRKSGLVGKADRDGWVETLVRVHQAKGLPDALDYKLEAPVTTSGVSPAEKLAPVQTHDLTLTLERIHEVELLDLLSSYAQQVPGHFRLQSCQLRALPNAGLTATCLLRFFNQPLGQPATPTS